MSDKGGPLLGGPLLGGPLLKGPLILRWTPFRKLLTVTNYRSLYGGPLVTEADGLATADHPNKATSMWEMSLLEVRC